MMKLKLSVAILMAHQVNSIHLQKDECVNKKSWAQFNYPYDLAPRGDKVDNYTMSTGDIIEIGDPYRFLEDPDSVQTKKWVEA